MKIDVLTLFPNMFEGFIKESIIKRAIESEKVKINFINFRDYSLDPHSKVDDTPFGGGPGMVLMLQPIYDALMSIRTADSYVILLTPTGKTYNQSIAKSLSLRKHIIIICGHYEGFDERIKNFIDVEISIGDYILTGGEIPAMAICDSVIRLLDNVITKESLIDESFNNNLLDYPNYTKPRDFMGLCVPDVLLSGNHKNINEYRRKEKLRVTMEKRADLMEDSNE